MPQVHFFIVFLKVGGYIIPFVVHSPQIGFVHAGRIADGLLPPYFVGSYLLLFVCCYRAVLLKDQA